MAFRSVGSSLLPIAALAWVTLGATGVAQEIAQAPPEAVTVGLYVSPPFVVEEENRFEGMAVDLWESIASDLGLSYDYRVLPTLRDLVDATAAGEVDVAVTNLTITQRRAERIDFTHPWYDAGLRLMINEEQGTGFWAVVSGLRQSGYLRAYAWLAFVIVAATVLLTLFDRRFDKDFPRRWRDGIAESFYSVMSIATSGKASRKNLFGWVGRIWAGVWMVCGVAVLAYVTSTVTSVMTTLALTNQINSIADLPGKTVAVFTGSVAEDFARDSALATRSYDGIDQAVAALLAGRVAAIVGDAPVLEYYAHRHNNSPLAVVGAIFEPDKYGFATTQGTSLSRSLTLELLGAHEAGLVEELRARYFGGAT